MLEIEKEILIHIKPMFSVSPEIWDFESTDPFIKNCDTNLLSFYNDFVKITAKDAVQIFASTMQQNNLVWKKYRQVISKYKVQFCHNQAIIVEIINFTCFYHFIGENHCLNFVSAVHLRTKSCS